MCLHINQKARETCNLNFIVLGEGLLKVTDSHVRVQCKSGSISETVLNNDVVTTEH